MKKIQITEEQAEADNRTILPPPIFADIKETRRQLGDCGHTKIYELIKQNELEKVKLGAKTLITVASIQRYAKKLIDEAAA